MTKKIIFLSLISTLFVGCVAFPEDGYYDGRYDHRYDYDDRRYDQHDRYERERDRQRWEYQQRQNRINAEPKSARDNNAVFLFNILSFPFTSYKNSKAKLCPAYLCQIRKLLHTF